ncbi:MAG: potassium channel family protein [Albidovulum sp.]|nr:potassium channel family protein [Albidovulum sp.]
MKIPKLSDRRYFWYVYACLCVLALASTAMQQFVLEFANSASIFQFMLFSGTVLGLFPISKASTAFLTRTQAISVVVTSAAINITCFAVLHVSIGLIDTTEYGSEISFRDGLYFSTVTFSTLGYGDFQPTPDGRLLAASQALCGYLYMGLVIGLAVNGFMPLRHATSGQNNSK